MTSSPSTPASAPNRRGRIAKALRHWLEQGGERVGEVAIRPHGQGGYHLTHWQEANAAPAALEAFERPEAARQIALYDDAGVYRPLKTAANLRHGWLLRLENLAALLEALDFFYPAALGVQVAAIAGELPVVPLRETLGRQSGMYAVTRKVSDAGALAAIAGCCRAEAAPCLKTILWELPAGEPSPSLNARAEAGALPLPCNEACNLLVAAIREEVKKG